MVGRLKVAVLVDTFEQRELRDPDVLMRSLADRGRAECRTDRAQDVTGVGVLVGHAKDDVTDFGVVDGRDGRTLGLVEELGQRESSPSAVMRNHASPFAPRPLA